jgi:hypothetical protein
MCNVRTASDLEVVDTPDYSLIEEEKPPQTDWFGLLLVVVMRNPSIF